MHNVTVHHRRRADSRNRVHLYPDGPLMDVNVPILFVVLIGFFTFIGGAAFAVMTERRR